MRIFFLIFFSGLISSDLLPISLSDVSRVLGCASNKIVDVAPYFKLFVGSPEAKKFFEQRGRFVTLINEHENELKELVKGKTVFCSKPDRASAQEIESVLSRMKCEHERVFSADHSLSLPRESLRPAEVYFVEVGEDQGLVFSKCGKEAPVECTKDFIEKMRQINVWVWGGVF